MALPRYTPYTGKLKSKTGELVTVCFPGTEEEMKFATYEEATEYFSFLCSYGKCAYTLFFKGVEVKPR